MAGKQFKKNKKQKIQADRFMRYSANRGHCCSSSERKYAVAKGKEKEVWYSGKIVKKEREWRRSAKEREEGKGEKNIAKQMNQTSSRDKSRAEPNDFRQLHLECQIGF